MAFPLPLLLLGAAALLFTGNKKSTTAPSSADIDRTWPPEPGKVFEPLNAIQAGVTLFADGRGPYVLMFYKAKDGNSRMLRQLYGLHAEAHSDVPFAAIPFKMIYLPHTANAEALAYYEGLMKKVSDPSHVVTLAGPTSSFNIIHSGGPDIEFFSDASAILDQDIIKLTAEVRAGRA